MLHPAARGAGMYRGGVLVHHVPKVLPSWKRQPKAAPGAPSTTGTMANSKYWGSEMAALNQKTLQ